MYIAPTLLRAGVATHLHIDVHLAGVLHAVGWSGESVHRWKPEWSGGAAIAVGG